MAIALVGFAVDDIAATVNELEQRGVAFEDYDLPPTALNSSRPCLGVHPLSAMPRSMARRTSFSRER